MVVNPFLYILAVALVAAVCVYILRLLAPSAPKIFENGIWAVAILAIMFQLLEFFGVMTSPIRGR